MQRRSGILFCLVGPAGGGKTTIAAQLIKRSAGNLRKSVSVTSRAPRVGEVDGVSYHFVSREDFQRRVSAQEFFEWEEVHGNLYGTLRSSLDEAVRSGVDLSLDIDIRGSATLREAYPNDTVVVYVVPPSVEVLRERVLARGSVKAEELERRLQTAAAEYSRMRVAHSAPEGREYFVVNEVFEDAVRQCQEILNAERCRFRRLRSQAVEEICAVK